MKRICSLLLVLILLCTGVFAAEPSFEEQNLEQIMADFMAENGLNEGNFSLSYYNTVTEESYAFNDAKFSLSASTYKLPLNMYFYDLERQGELSGDTVISWTNRTLDEIHEQSLLWSNNELSEALLYYWKDYALCKQKLRIYFTMTDEEIDSIYYDDSRGTYFCVRMMMDCLQELYRRSDEFPELLDYLCAAQPGEYFKRGVTEYEVAHKYGYLDCCQNDVGIIYTPQPILLAVYTQGIYGEQVCAQAARLLTDYTLWQQDRAPEPEPEPEPELKSEPEPEPEPEPIPAPPAEPATEDHARPGGPWMLAVGVLILAFCLRKKK